MAFDHDMEIIRLLSLDDRRAIALLVESHYRTLFKTVVALTRNKQDTEDILQDTILVIWEKRKEIKLSAPIRPFLVVIAYHKSINFIKLRHRRDSVLLDICDDWATEIPAASEGSALLQLHRELRRAIRLLPPKTRAPYILSRNFGMNNQEIAVQLNLSVKTIEKHMSKAIRLLRRLVTILMILLLY